MKMKLTKNYLHHFDLISISNLSKKETETNGKMKEKNETVHLTK
jgi:hypothetical protein